MRLVLFSLAGFLTALGLWLLFPRKRRPCPGPVTPGTPGDPGEPRLTIVVGPVHPQEKFRG